jgi:hypothetical protein
MPQYISTDPNAGMERQYLSTDPRAGSGASLPVTPGVVTPGVVAGMGAAKLAPAIVSGVNKTAGLVGEVGSSPLVKMVTGALAPKVTSVVEKATAPSGTRLSAILDAAGKPMSAATKAGPVMRGANALSRIFSTLSLPLTLASSLYDTYQGGQAHAAKLDDPSRSQAEKDEILRQLMSHGGF